MSHNFTMDYMSSNQSATSSADEDAIGYLLFVIHIVLAAFLLFCNTLTIAAICLTPDLQTLTNAHVANLAFADLLMGVATVIQCFLFLPQTRDAYDNNLYVCILFYYVLPYTSAVQSQLCLLLIALDRLLYIDYPLQYPVYVTEKSVTASIVGSWVLAFALGGVPIYWNSYDSSRSTNRCVSEDVMNTLYYWELLPGTMLGSIVVATVCYVRIILIARKQRRRSKVSIPLSLVTLQTRLGDEGTFRRRTNIGIDQHGWKAYSTTDIPNHVLQSDSLMPLALCAMESGALQERRNTLPVEEQVILKITCVPTEISSHLSNSAPSRVESINAFVHASTGAVHSMGESVNDGAPIQNSDEINSDCAHPDANHNTHKESDKCRLSSHLSQSDDSWAQRTTGNRPDHFNGLCPSMHADSGSGNSIGGCVHDGVCRLSNDSLAQDCADSNNTLNHITTYSRAEYNAAKKQCGIGSVHETFSDDAPIGNYEHVNGTCSQMTEHSSAEHDEGIGLCPSYLIVHEATGAVHMNPSVHVATGRAYSTNGCIFEGVKSINSHLSDNEPVTGFEHMNGTFTLRTARSSAGLINHDNGKAQCLNGTLTPAHICNDSPVGCCIHIHCACSQTTNFPIEPYAEKEICTVNAVSESDGFRKCGEFHHNGETNGTDVCVQPCQNKKTSHPLNTIMESKDLKSSTEFHKCEEHHGTGYDEECEDVHLLEKYNGSWDSENETELRTVNPFVHAATGTVYSTTHTVYSTGGSMHKLVKDDHHLGDNNDGDLHNSKEIRWARLSRGSTVSLYVEDNSDSDNTNSAEFHQAKPHCGGFVDSLISRSASIDSIDVVQRRENGAKRNTDNVRSRDSFRSEHFESRHSREIHQDNPLVHAATGTVNSVCGTVNSVCGTVNSVCGTVNSVCGTVNSTGGCTHNGVQSEFATDSAEPKDNSDFSSPAHSQHLGERRLTLISRNSTDVLSPLMHAASGTVYNTVGRTHKGVKTLRHFRDFQLFSEYRNRFFNRRRNGARSVYMFFTVNILFAVCWVPYLLAILLGDTVDVDHNARAFLFFVASCNSGVNFVIYAWKTKEFRRAYRRLIVCKCTVH